MPLALRSSATPEFLDAAMRLRRPLHDHAGEEGGFGCIPTRGQDRGKECSEDVSHEMGCTPCRTSC